MSNKAAIRKNRYRGQYDSDDELDDCCDPGFSNKVSASYTDVVQKIGDSSSIIPERSFTDSSHIDHAPTKSIWRGDTSSFTSASSFASAGRFVSVKSDSSRSGRVFNDPQRKSSGKGYTSKVAPPPLDRTVEYSAHKTATRNWSFSKFMIEINVRRDRHVEQNCSARKDEVSAKRDELLKERTDVNKELDAKTNDTEEKKRPFLRKVELIDEKISLLDQEIKELDINQKQAYILFTLLVRKVMTEKNVVGYNLLCGSDIESFTESDIETLCGGDNPSLCWSDIKTLCAEVGVAWPHICIKGYPQTSEPLNDLLRSEEHTS